MNYTVDIVTAPERTIAVGHFHIALAEMAEMGTRIGRVFGRVMSTLTGAGVAAQGPAVARYVQTGDGFDVAAGFPFEGRFEPDGEVGVVRLGGTEAAHVTHVGSYDGLPNAYEALRAGAAAQGRPLDPKAPMWEEYWTGPDAPPEQARTEIYWPVTAA